jgi:hypothetical protein
MSESERCNQRQPEMAVEPRGEVPETDAILLCEPELTLPQRDRVVEAEAVLPRGPEILSQLSADCSARTALAGQGVTSDKVNSQSNSDYDRQANEENDGGHQSDGDNSRGPVEAERVEFDEAQTVVKPPMSHEQQDKDSLLEDSDRQEDSMISAEDAFQGKGFCISASEVPFGAGFS